MGRYDSGYYGFAPYVSVAEKQKRNKKAVAKLQKKDANITPVVIEGRSIANSWWGKSWNKNLERYADYSNRIGRGRSYVRHGAVLDLQVSAGVVTAIVQGSDTKPYEISIKIKKLPTTTWQLLKKESLAQLESLSELLSGKFPKSLQETFFAKGKGIFPSPQEISFDCSCPDWASMCKHVASALYGIGNRLDMNPELLFKLRQVSIDDLISGAIESTTENLINKAESVNTSDILADGDLEDVFGIAIDDAIEMDVELPTVDSFKADAKSSKAKKKNKVRNKPTVTTKKTTPERSQNAKVTKTKRNEKKVLPKAGEMTTQLLKASSKLKKEFSTQDIIKKLPDWSRSQITNTLQRMILDGKIKRVERGIYVLSKRPK
jgi:uncharacterized Zn finger protein